MRALLRAVMYVVAIAAGADAYLIGSKYLTEVHHMPSDRAQVTAGVIAAVLALIVATVPVAIYQSTMRRVIARRRAAAGELSRGRTEPAAPPAPAALAQAPAPAPQIPQPRGPLYRPSLPEPPLPDRSPPALSADGSRADLPGRAAEQEVEDCQRRLAAVERVFGPEHPHTFATRRDLASAYWSTGELAQATTMYETILADCHRALGPTHLDTLICRSDLAAAYEMDGRLDEAISLYAHTLAIRERVLGAQHPDTVSTRSSLAVAYSVRDNLTRGRGEGSES